MSYCKEDGKDKIMFLTPEDLMQPTSLTLPEDEEPPGLILPSGEINWNCPCLGGMATGPCGVEFRDAFTCFHFSQSESKGSDCYEAFKTMQDCMVQYPTVYGDRAENDRSSDDTLMSSEGEDPSIEEPSNSNTQENTATTKA